MRQGALKYFLRNIVVKHRVSVRDKDDNEVYYTYLSLLRLVGLVLELVIVVFVGTVLLCLYTPILDLFPNYVGHESKHIMAENLTKLDSLGIEISDMMDYVDNITMVLEGKSPVTRTMSETEEGDVSEVEFVAPSKMDSLLRAEMEGTGRYALNEGFVEPEKRYESEFLSPVRGEVIEHFDAGSKQYATKVRVRGISQVTAVQSGTVLLNLWSPEQGNVLQIQHSSGYIATYKNMSQVFKTTGDKVMAGEIIGTIWTDENNPTADFGFELWVDGQPIDACNYISF